ncbi:MAG: DNA recombination/repair protein RecA, partial [Eggerthellaceae bacterium]|nr:DNA recombination/repair protein RecA [Eggerthellaceae bacterium]
EIEGEIGEATVGAQARLMSQALRKLAGSLSKSNTTCIFINQIREKIDVFYGNPETTPGGRALRFFASVRLEIRRVDSIKRDGEVIGNRVRVKVVKNKVAPPFKQAEFDIMYGTGISKEGSVLDMAADCGIVSKMGPWYSYGTERLGQGREAAKEYLRTNPELLDEIDTKVRQKTGLEFDDEEVGAPIDLDTPATTD